MIANILISIIAAVGFSLTAVYVSIARRHKPTWRAGAVMLAACAELTLAHALQGISSDFATKVFWYKMVQLGFTITPTAYLCLALRYSGLGYLLTPRTYFTLSVFPALTAVLIFTNEMHGLVWNLENTAPIVNSLSFLSVADARIWYWLFVAYSYLIMGLGCFYIARLLARSPGIYEWQAIAVVIAAIIAILGSVLDIFRISPLPPFLATALGLAIGSITVAYILSPLRRRDVLSVTREAILNSINDSIIVVDEDGRIVGMNLAAEKLAGKSKSQAITKPLDKLSPELKSIWSNNITKNGEVTIKQENILRTFDMRVSTIQNLEGRMVSQVIVLRDITERKRAEAELTANREAEQKFSEQLTILANVTYDLSTAKTLDELCRRAVEAGRNQLGYDRLALWFVTNDHATMLGTYGTSINGQTTDERYARHAIAPTSRVQPVVDGNVALQEYDDAPLYEVDGKQVGLGSHVIAGLWDGETVIGFLTVDNLINQKPFTDHDCELLRLYALALGHLCTLKRAQEKLTQLTEVLEQRVIERTAELETANKELEAFAYSVSHDLRAPLRAIDGYTRILVENYEAFLDTEGKRVCSVVRSEARRMGKLIDDLLAFSRFSRTEMQTTKINMVTLANSAYQTLTSPTERERIDFYVDALPPTMGDPTLMRQVWINLISNAIKFSSKRDRVLIHITGRLDANEIIYSIHDNGTGFNMNYANKLFGVFQRLHNEEEYPGTGVGLAIAQRIIFRHGGRVWAESIEDQGTTFYFALPISHDNSPRSPDSHTP